MPHLTLVWTEASASDEALLEAAASSHGATLRRVARATLPTEILAAIVSGAVVYVATSARDASDALRLGADEVVRVGHLTRASLARAFRRAEARADARTARAELSSRANEEVGTVLTLLAAVLGHEMNTPLAVASLNCEAITERLAPMLEMQERLLGWATLSAPKEQIRALMQKIAQQPTPSELKAMLGDLREGIGRAAHVARLLLRLSSEEDGGGTTGATAVIEDVHELLRGQLAQHAKVELDIEGACVVRVGRPTVVFFVTALLAHALDAVRNVLPKDALIVIRGAQHDDAVLIEIEHNGRAIAADLRPSMLDPYFTLPSQHAAGELSVDALQKRVRALGGDLLVLGEPQRTTLRLLLPAVEQEIDLVHGGRNGTYDAEEDDAE